VCYSEYGGIVFDNGTDWCKVWYWWVTFAE
jgi:hypothetical protein